MKKIISASLAALMIAAVALTTSCSLGFLDDIGSAISEFVNSTDETTQPSSAKTEESTTSVTPRVSEPQIVPYNIPDEEFSDDIEREASQIIDGAIEKAVSYVLAMRDDSRSHISYSFDPDANGYFSSLDPAQMELCSEMIASAEKLEQFTVTDKEYGKSLKEAYFAIFTPFTYGSPDVASYADYSPVTSISADYQTTYRSISIFYFDPYKDGNTRISGEAGMSKLEHDVALLGRVVSRVVRFMPEGLSTYDKYYYLAAVLSEHVVYDDRPANCFTAFGALVCGKAVCEGYAGAFYLLCREADLWCAYRNGQPRGEGHAWNMVKLESGIYNVDVTWCDVTDAYRSRWYDNFMKSDEEFADHSFTSGVEGTGVYEPDPYETIFG